MKDNEIVLLTTILLLLFGLILFIYTKSNSSELVTLHTTAIVPSNDTAPTIEPFFGENIPAPRVLTRPSLMVRDDGEEDVQKGVDTMFDYSNRFLDAQLEASRIPVLPPTQPGEIVCR